MFLGDEKDWCDINLTKYREAIIKMATDTQKRQRILRKIYQIPSDKLNEIEEFLSHIDKRPHKKSQNLSYAGIWKNIDESVFEDLTENLINNRERNRRRFDG